MSEIHAMKNKTFRFAAARALTPLLAALVLAGCATAPAPLAQPLPELPAAPVSRHE